MARRREPIWIERLILDAVHFDQLREHGGLRGLRDENALESALARPKQRWNYDRKADLPALAASLGHALSSSHPYRDGNKRIAFLALATFLELNGLTFDAPETEVVEKMLALASGALSEAQLAQWLRSRANAS